MIPFSEISKEVETSKSEKITSLFLTQLIFTIVDSALKKHYKDTYCMRCIPSSLAIQSILKDFGLRATLLGNDFCAAEVFYNTDYVTWGGFWDKDHHVWLISEFNEIIDLTITKIHEHPSRSRSDGIPKPAVWWQDPTGMPPVIKYIPHGKITLQLDEEETTDIDTFLQLVVSEKERILSQYDIMDINMRPTLYDLSSFNYLHEKGHPWLIKSFIFQEKNIPFPKWIIDKEKESIAYFESIRKSVQ